MDYLLYQAVNWGNLTLASYAIQYGANIHCYNEAPLLIACKRGYIEIVKLLLSIPNDPANIHINDDEPVILASLNDHKDIVKLLLENPWHPENPANINAGDGTLLCHAVDNGDDGFVMYLLDHKADIHAGGEYAFRVSATKSSAYMLKCLFNRTSDFPNIHYDDDIALRNAISNRRYSMAKYLLEMGANVNAGDDFPLRTTIEHCTLEDVEMLFKYGKPNISAYNYEALVTASRLEHIDVANFLMEKLDSAERTIVGNKILCSINSKTKPDIISYILQNNYGDVHINNEMPLRNAVEYNNYNVVVILLKYSANPHVNNDSLLVIACDYNYDSRIIKLLLEIPLDIHVDNDSPLRTITDRYSIDLDVVKMLVENIEPANIHAEHCEAIINSWRHGNNKIADYLIDKLDKLSYEEYKRLSDHTCNVKIMEKLQKLLR